MRENPLDALEERVVRLERQAARGRAIGFGGLGALALALLLIAAAPRAASAPGGGPAPLTVAEPFVVEDSAGNPIATFGGGGRARVNNPAPLLLAFQTPAPIPNAPFGDRPQPIPLTTPGGRAPDAGCTSS